MKELVVIADGGGTKTVATLRSCGREVEITAGPCVPFLRYGQAVETLRDVRDRLLNSVDVPVSQACVSIALATAGLEDLAITARFRADLLTMFSDVALISDGEAALQACVGSGPGAVISVGTGVVVRGRWRDGSPFQLDGWGWPAGDRGGGAWIGRQAVEWFLAANDLRHGREDPLFAVLAETIGTDRTAILRWLTTVDRTTFASLARRTVILANRSSAAGILLRSAAAEIERSARYVLSHGLDRLHLTGGLASSLVAYLDGRTCVLRTDAVLEGAALHAQVVFGSQRAGSAA